MIRYFLTSLGYIASAPHPGGGIVRTCLHCGKHASACEKTRSAWLAIDEQAERADVLDLHRKGIAA